MICIFGDVADWKSFLEEKQKLLFFFLSTVILTGVEGSVFEGSVPIRTA